MNSSLSAKWFLMLILGAAFVTFTVTGCGSKDAADAAAIEEAADEAAADVEEADAKAPDHPEHPK